MLRTMAVRTTLVMLACALSISAHAIADALRQVDIPAGDLRQALLQVSRQFGTDLVYSPEQVDGIRTRGAHGVLTAEQVITKLLEGTPLDLRTDPSGAMLIAPPVALKETSRKSDKKAEPPLSFWSRFRLSEAGRSSPSGPEISLSEEGAEEIVVRIPEVLVSGKKSLNADIRRTRDDAQPYVVFERRIIEQSGAANLQEFLKQRLPMNSARTSTEQSSNVLGAASNLGLRGLGNGQTLILIDGRRIPSFNNAGSFMQNDVNGVPLAAIERIEILPTTASGIYGGAATGGVINIILRRDYDASDLQIGYESPFDGGGTTRRIDFMQGFQLESGRTNILLTGQYSDSDPLKVEERDLVQRGIAAIRQNNPGFFTTATTPPLGATTNIRSVSGAPLFGPGTPNFTSVPAGYAGGQGLEPFRANAGTYNQELAESALIAGGGRAGLRNGPVVKSVLLTARRDFTANLQAYLDLSASDSVGHMPTNQTSTTFTIAATAPNNPFGQAVRVTVPSSSADGEWRVDSSNWRAAAGAILALPHDWMAYADITWGEAERQAFNPPILDAGVTAAIGSGAVDVLRDVRLGADPLAAFVRPSNPLTGQTPFRSVTLTPSLRFSGPIASIAGGKVLLSSLLEYRKDDNKYAETGGFAVPARSQTSRSAYLEARIPFVSAANRRRGLEELELQVAARHDRYAIEAATGFVSLGSPTPIVSFSTDQDSTDPTIGVRYRPLREVLLRASYGTGFVPPSSSQLLANAPQALPPGTATDPRRGSEPTGQVTRFSGGSQTLRPEQSESWSAGLVWTPAFVPGIRLAVDYVRIEKTGNIAAFSPQSMLDNEAFFPERVNREPATPGDPFGVGRVLTIDTSFANAARQDVEAFDIAVDYEREVANLNTLRFFAAATRTTHFKNQIAPASLLEEQVGTTASLNTPLELKANAGVTWSHGSWSAGWTSSYYHSYSVVNPVQILNQGANGKVSSQIYHDVSASWARDTEAGFLGISGIEVRGGVKNLFGARPPFDASNSSPGFYFYSPHGDPRLATYHVSVRVRF